MKLHGVDHDSAKIETARRVALPGVEFSTRGLDSFPEASFDAVSIFDVLYTVRKQVWGEILRGCSRALRQAGFNVVRVANNHMIQHGIAAFVDTLERVRGAGIAAAGVEGPGGRTQPVDLQIEGQHLRIVAFSMRPEQYYQGRPLYSHSEEQSQILEEVAALRAGCDHLIVSVHWGDEYMSRPQAAQVRFARALIEQGVRVILGHHPHVLQGWEYHGEGLILYSLGNFVTRILAGRSCTRTRRVSSSFELPGLRAERPATCAGRRA